MHIYILNMQKFLSALYVRRIGNSVKSRSGAATVSDLQHTISHWGNLRRQCEHSREPGDLLNETELAYCTIHALCQRKKIFITDDVFS